MAEDRDREHFNLPLEKKHIPELSKSEMIKKRLEYLNSLDQLKSDQKNPHDE